MLWLSERRKKFMARIPTTSRELTWHDLDILYYNKFPDQWEGDLYLQGENYERILAAGSGETERQRKVGERSTTEYIGNGTWRIWQVGRVYLVAEQSAKRGELDQHTMGKLKLVSIEPGKSSDVLKFEVVK